RRIRAIQLRPPPPATLFPYTTLFRSCQGFSEPDAGSDLANLRTTARVLDDDGFEITGRKIWTTNGLEATHCMLLARTDPRASKQDRKSTRLNSSHRTISYAVFCLKKT